MNLNESWRYDSYLSHLSISELSYRGGYLIENLVSLELNGKIGMRDIRYDPAHTLMQKFTHVLQELQVRGEEFEKRFLEGTTIPKPMLGHENRLETLKKLAITKKPHLIKFGKKEYLEKLSFKVSLASSFSDSSLNSAQMDDEMKAIYTPSPRDASISEIDGTPISGVQNIEITYQAKEDYYIFCSSAGFDVRLFGDFEADACLFIYDSEKFSQELYRRVSSHVEVKDYGYKPVTYVDPIRSGEKKLPPIEFHKHMKYLYQNEYRHVFILGQNSQIPKDLYLKMPECSGYTELICL